MSGAFTVGQLTTFLNYVNQYTKPFNDISSVLSELQSAIACAERLYAILDEENEPLPVKAQLNADSIQGQIEFKDVSFGYTSQNTLINHLNLSIPAASKSGYRWTNGGRKINFNQSFNAFFMKSIAELFIWMAFLWQIILYQNCANKSVWYCKKRG